MTGAIRNACSVAILLLLLAAVPAGATRVPPGFVDEAIATGFVQPVNFDFLPDGRVLVVERASGRIRLARPGQAIIADTVGTVSNLRTSTQEQGLLGIAVDPRWPAKPFIYVHSTYSLSPNLRISRFQLTGDLLNTGDGRLALDPVSRQEILEDLPDDNWLHNGGTLLFGPGGMLYVALGDDGVPCGAQDIHQLRGKILRLDVSQVPDSVGPAPFYSVLAPEDNPFANDPDPRARTVWQYGLRNPWTFDFDRVDQGLVIGDVGEGQFEEIDTTHVAARNFGWPFFEGNAFYQLTCANPEIFALTAPVLTYSHYIAPGPKAIIIGGVCPQPPDLTLAFPPQYWRNVFYHDLYEGKIRRLALVEDHYEVAMDVAGQQEPGVWGDGFQGTARMRFHQDGRLWFVQGNTLRRISYPGGLAAPADPHVPRLELAAYPVPARSGLTFLVRAPFDGPVAIEIHDLKGRSVRRLEGRVARDGTARVAWDGRDASGRQLPGGVYFARGSGDGSEASARVVLL